MRFLLYRALMAAALLASGDRAFAHPHILINAKTDVIFNSGGAIVAVRNTWQFDEAFSAYAIQGYDSKGDGKPTRKDLDPLAQINVKSLAAYHYFTNVKTNGVEAALDAPKDYWDEFINEVLTLHFTLPLKTPLPTAGRTLDLNVYDPEYFAAISFDAKDPINLVDAKDCNATVQRPAVLDSNLASQLSVIPADQRELPPDLFAVTAKLVNGAAIACR